MNVYLYPDLDECLLQSVSVLVCLLRLIRMRETARQDSAALVPRLVACHLTLGTHARRYAFEVSLCWLLAAFQ
jgi:hypothetical protein